MNSCIRRLALALVELLAVNAFSATRYVDLNNPNPASPYLNWAAAATNIQDAIDAASPGDLVLVTNGIYQTGATSIAPYIVRSRMAVTKALTVQSVNGPAVTIICGEKGTGAFGLGTSAIRCAYLTNGVLLSGFTLTNGATRSSSIYPEGGGGAVYCESTAIVSNCVFINCSAYLGGGAFGGTLKDCMLTNNIANFGGGGAMYSVLNNCSIIWSTCGYSGGGTYLCMATNCLYVDNLGLFGGAAFKGTLSQCTVVGNIAWHNSLGEGGYGGGVHSCTNYNSILYFNFSYAGGDNWTSVSFTNCCTTPLPEGSGNFTNNPILYDEPFRNLHLGTNSPCINAGANTYAGGAFDLDGRARIVGGTVDVGAYELQAGDFALFVPWLGQNYLPTGGSADFADADGDGANNYLEWRADTIPTNAASALRMIGANPGMGGAGISWESVNTRKYWLERRASLITSSPFAMIATNIIGQTNTTLYNDTNAGAGPFFYRVGVQK